MDTVVSILCFLLIVAVTILKFVYMDELTGAFKNGRVFTIVILEDFLILLLFCLNGLII